MLALIHTVDRTVPLDCTKKIELKKKEAYQKFVQDYCKVCHYMFSMKKCGQPSCKLLPEIFLSIRHWPDHIPDQSGDHFQELIN